jgi:hypothetical protein
VYQCGVAHRRRESQERRMRVSCGGLGEVTGTAKGVSILAFGSAWPVGPLLCLLYELQIKKKYTPYEFSKIVWELFDDFKGFFFWQKLIFLWSIGLNKVWAIMFYSYLILSILFKIIYLSKNIYWKYIKFCIIKNP